MTSPLNNASFHVPYQRQGLPAGVLHLGLGAFHRAHQAMVFDALLRAGDTRWGILGAAMRSTQLAEALASQDGLYSVQVASRAGREWQVVGSLLQTCVAAREPDRIAAAIASPATRWITLTVTEKGYTAELGALLVQGLAVRHAAGLRGLTIASCDNLSGNGRKLQQLCTEAAEAAGKPALAGWISSACAFPCSMVDRIVPAATAARRAQALAALGVDDACALGTEGFWEWVLENRLADPADAALLAGAGVTLVQDVTPFEEAKLRMLNGSHTAMACIGAVAGLPTICDVVTQPAVRALVHGLMTEEVAPHLARPGLDAYRDALLARFANPDLGHSVHQIATDSSQKIPQRWPPSIVAQLAAGACVERLAFGAAAWMRYQLGVDEQGQAYVINDPMAAQTQALAREHQGDASATVAALLSLKEIWRDVPVDDSRFSERAVHWLRRIHEKGVLAAAAEVGR